MVLEARIERSEPMDAMLDAFFRACEPRTVEIPTRDGLRLAASVFEPAGPSADGGVGVINSATGVPRDYYAPFAAFLASRGFVAVTYDYRGIGDSRPRR